MVVVVEDVPERDHAAGRREEAVRPHPLVVVELREVVAPAVGQDDHDHRARPAGLQRQLVGHLEGGDHRRAARLAGQDPLLPREAAGHREGVPVGDADPAVDERRVEGARQEVLPHSLGEVRPGRVPRQDAALGVGAHHDQVRPQGPEMARGAADRAAGPDAGDQVRDPAGCLLPDLGTRRRLVGARVLLVPVLVGLEGARDVAGQARCDRVVALRRFRRHVRRAEHDLGAVGPQDRLLLGRLLVGHHEDAAVALEGGGDRQAVPGVARRRLDDRAARPQQPVALRRLDHREADPVLHRAAGAQHLELGEHERLVLEGADAPGQAADPDERRLADEVEDGLGVLHEPGV